MENTTLQADVMLPVPLHRFFTYIVPPALVDSCRVGCRVIVPFGNHRIKTGIVSAIHNNKLGSDLKEILDVLDTTPIIHPFQVKLYQWVAEYYMCSIGEVMNVAIPSGLKLTSESSISMHPEYDLVEQSSSLNDKEFLLMDALSAQDQLTYDEISSLLGIKHIYHIIKSLREKGAILIFEQLKEKYKPRKEKWLRLSPKFLEDKNGLELLFQMLEKKKGQMDVLLHYLRCVPVLENAKANALGILKSSFDTEAISSSSLNTMIKNGIFEEESRVVSRFQPVSQLEASTTLSAQQAEKLIEIKTKFETQNTILLQGVTGSGKTEIFIKLIEEALEQNQQVLYLLPEIALTAQIVVRLKKVFGDYLGVYHSKHSDNERVEVWLGLLKGNFKIIVGVRSAVFLPFDNLALVIVDEEYESTFKQYDQAPRYHARDVAIYMANMLGAKVLLGTATPSLETYHNAAEGKYGHVLIDSRYNETRLPELSIVDIKTQRKKKLMKNEFSNILIDEINMALESKEQVIIFQNRRGYAPMLSCDDCGHIPKCHQCSVSLTYHQNFQELRCHYCGYKESLPQTCGECGSSQLRTKGFGTEKLEEDLTLLFPSATVGRMDLDTTRSKYGYQQIIEEFEQKQIDILVGTQMVTKGLDFDNVGLVGVVDADKMINFPDFRAHERAFQLITQVGGRAGRRAKQGKVIVQTYDPTQPILRHLLSQEYAPFYQDELTERQKFHYPPYYRIIRITIRHKDKGTAQKGAKHLAGLLLPELGKQRVLGPQEPIISRIRNYYLEVITIKLEKQGVNLTRVRNVLKRNEQATLALPEFKNLSVIFDVDPM